MKVYFDNAATTPLHPKVFEKINKFLENDFGNPSSIHSFGRTARVAVEDARETIASFINADPGEIYFTSGGTEANNFAITGIAKAEYNETKRNKIIVTQADHHSVIDTAKELENSGYKVEYCKVTKDATIDYSVCQSLIDANTSLISAIHINNETGSINDPDKISDSTNNIFFHTDAVQSFGKIPIDVTKLCVHSLSASSHKINGPKGCGILYVKSGTPISPIIFGGSQERNRRGGTENVAAIVGFAEAVKIAHVEMNDNYKHVRQLREIFIHGLSAIDKSGIQINGGSNPLPYILSITFNSEFYNNDAEAMLIYLDINGIAASNGAACTSGTLKPSHVMLASGKSIQDANGTIRFSFGSQNNIDEVNYTLEVLEKLVKKFKK